MEDKMDQKENTTAQDDIALIKRVMEDSRRIFVEDGKMMMLWGTLVVIGLMAQYAALTTAFPLSDFWIWTVCIGTGWVVTLCYSRTREARSCVQTFAGKMLSTTWMACGMAMTMIGFIAVPSGVIQDNAISGIFALIMGIGSYISGNIFQTPWVRVLAAVWWAGAVIIFIKPGLYTILLFAAMMVFFEIIPGMVFYRAWKKALKEAPYARV